MSALLLLSSLAFGDPPEPTYQRLFAADASAMTTAAPEPGALPTSGWAWPALLSAAGLVGAWQLRKRVTTAPEAEMRVVQRHALGDKSALVLVEVQDASGATRRLLLGSSGAGLSLLNDLGEVSARRLPAQFGDVALPSEDDEMEADNGLAPANRVDEFQRMLSEVLVEREPDAPSDPTEVPERPRFFSDDDLAPTAEVAARRPSRRRANFRGRFNAPAGAIEPANNPGWSPVIESFTPAPMPELTVSNFAEPIVEPVRRGAAALIKAPKAQAAPAKSGLSLLVKKSLPEAVEMLAAPNLSVVPPLPLLTTPELSTSEVAPAAAFTAVALTAHAAAPQTRPVYRSPSMTTAPGAPADRRLVGPPLRDARLTAGAPVTPRLRLADSRSRLAEEAPVPDVAELVERLREAGRPEQARMAVNENVRPTRADGMRARFNAIVAKEGAR